MYRSQTAAKRPVLAIVLLALLALAPAAAGGTAPVEGAQSDVVVLLDVSQSVLPYFHDITDFVVSSVVKDFLRIGDTFHLLSFGDATQIEIAQRVDGEADVRSILARLYLLYPLARNTDLISAFSYLYQYLADLPESRGKVVVIITDGVQNPAAGSASAALSSEETTASLAEIAGRIRSNGWPVYVIKVPFSTERSAAENQAKTSSGGSAAGGSAAGGAQAGGAQTGGAQAGGAAAGTAAPGGKTAGASSATGRAEADKEAATALVGAVADALGAKVTVYNPDEKDDTARKSLALPLATFPADLGKKGYSFSFPLRVKNEGASTLALELDHVIADNVDILQRKSFLSLAAGKSDTMDVRVALPPTMDRGNKRLTVELYFADGLRVSPSRGVLAFELAPSPLSALFKSGSRVVLFIALLAGGLALVFGAVVFLLKRAPRKAAIPVVRAVRSSAEEAEEARRKKRLAVAGELNVAAAPPRGTAPVAAEQPFAGSAARPQPTAAFAPKAAAAAPSAAVSRPSYAENSLAAPAEGGAGPAPLPVRAKAAQGGKEGAAPLAPSLSAPPPSAGAYAGDERRRGMPLKEKGEKPMRRVQKTEAEKRETRPRRSPAYAPRILRPGSMQVELRVEEQNPFIGLRNVQLLSAGASKSLGGGRSDFLVFLVKVPSHVAELHFDGERCSFVPLDPAFFPELEGPLEDCLGKDIVMRSKQGYRMVLRFHKYVAPIDRMTRLLHCIETPGLFSED